MVMIDANVVLRYLLNDDEKMASEAEGIIKKESVHVSIEIIAEVVYVLKGVYHIGREEIRNSLLHFLSEVNAAEPDVLTLGIETYGEHNLDFPDCILYAYHKVGVSAPVSIRHFILFPLVSVYIAGLSFVLSMFFFNE